MINNLPLASIVNLEGKELFSISFPENDFNRCVGENMSYYGAGINTETNILKINFLTSCTPDIWCSYDLVSQKYLESGFWK